jgi:hypothetical protein
MTIEEDSSGVPAVPEEQAADGITATGVSRKFGQVHAV